MYALVSTKAYEKSLKKIRLSGTFKKQAGESLAEAIDLILEGKKLPQDYRDHHLTGPISEYRECHIKGDILLVYQIKEKALVLVLIDIGSHSYLGL
jgi:mRNA interferase YafQ